MSADSNTDKSLDKLKELEASIAKELDQKVKLAEPTDPRLDGSVQMNPSLNVTKPTDGNVISAYPKIESAPINTVMPVPNMSGPGINQMDKPINSDRRVEDITLEEVDALLSEEDEGFGSQLTQIRQAVGESQVLQNMESISISAEYLKDEKDDGTEEEIKINETDSVALPEDLFEDDGADFKDIKKSFWKHLRGITMSLILMPADILWRSGLHIWKSRKVSPKQILQELNPILKNALTKRQTLFQELFEHVRGYSVTHWVKLIVFFIMIYAFYFIVSDLRSNTRTVDAKEPFLKTFDEVADIKKKMSNEGKDVNSVPVPEFVVALPRIIANLQTADPRKKPMVAVELYIEASDREAAVEILARRKEAGDIIARILEQMTFLELDNPEGKDKLKLRIRMGINRMLNNGRTRQVFFKSIQIHE